MGTALQLFKKLWGLIQHHKKKVSYLEAGMDNFFPSQPYDLKKNKKKLQILIETTKFKVF
jgi:hypothetical protein